MLHTMTHVAVDELQGNQLGGSSPKISLFSLEATVGIGKRILNALLNPQRLLHSGNVGSDQARFVECGEILLSDFAKGFSV